MTEAPPIRAIDAVVNLWTPEALQQRPNWGKAFFVDKMRARDDLMAGLTLPQMIERMDQAGIGHAFLIAPKSGRVGLPGCYHLPPELVAAAVQQYDRKSGVRSDFLVGNLEDRRANAFRFRPQRVPPAEGIA